MIQNPLQTYILKPITNDLSNWAEWWSELSLRDREQKSKKERKRKVRVLDNWVHVWLRVKKQQKNKKIKKKILHSDLKH